MQLNDWFWLHHARRIHDLRRRLLAGEAPVIIRVGDHVIFLHRGRRDVCTIDGERYHALKSLAHVPVALHLWLAPLGEQPLPEPERALLEELARTLRQSREPPARPLVEATLAFLDEVLAAGTVARGALGRYIEATRRHVGACIEAASREELVTLDQAVRAFTRELDAAGWDALRVVICASHQARYRESSKQYFHRLFGEREGPGAKHENRVLFGESCRNEEEALTLLATHHLDRELGRVFFGDERAMQRDLRAEATARILDEIAPVSAASRAIGRQRSSDS